MSNLKNRLAKSKDYEKRTYEIEGSSLQLDTFEKMLYTIDKLGAWGSSNVVCLHYDGDGAARLNIKRTDKKEDLKEVEDLNDKAEKSNIDFYID